MRALLLYINIVACSFVALAQDYYDGIRSPQHWLVAVEAGLNSDGYEADLGVSWWPVSGFGIKMAIGMASEIGELNSWWDDDYDYDDYDDYDDCAMRFKFMPSLELRSPALLRFNGGSSTMHFFANPGLCLSPGAHGSRHAEWLNWQLRGGLEFDFDDVVIRAGYGYSNFNLYSGDPVCHNGLPADVNRHTHSGFLTFGYRF